MGLDHARHGRQSALNDATFQPVLTVPLQANAAALWLSQGQAEIVSTGDGCIIQIDSRCACST